MDHVQTVVVGAGVVGLAVARALAQSGREVVILEAEALIGSVTSARNSEVIHAGIYYAPGSLKAQLCVEGRHALYRYCTERGIPHRRCGKLIVATSEEERESLGGIAARARANGVSDLREISAAEALALEPALSCVSALHSPSTGIVDSHALMLSLLGEAEDRGAMLALNTPVEAIRLGTPFEISTGGETPLRISADEVVLAAGHGTAALTSAMGLPAPQTWLAKGNYFTLAGRAPFRHLIYPAPVAGGLGIHLTLDLAGQARFGPDVEWVDKMDYAVDPVRGEAFYAAIRRYWPDLEDGALEAGYAGIRPKIAGPSQPAADFRIESHGVPGLIALYGIESPGLTSCLALGDAVSAALQPRAMRRSAG
ncbi:MAG: NAD(P)/FAD-dependent oxidoreductase [Pseudomonadota bacterium]